MAVCPVYRVLAEEQASPRAKIQLITAFKEQRLPTSPLLKSLVNRCLMCGSCTAACPSGVDHVGRFMRMREQMRRDHGERLEIRSLVFLLARERRLRLAASVARMGRAVVPAKLQERYRPGDIAIRDYPRLNHRPFRSAVPESVPAIGKKRGTVVYFTGCATNFLFEETGFSTLRLLGEMGYQVIIPAKQTCCGLPMLYHGAVDQARANIATNLACLRVDGIDAVVVDCPTCGSALKNEYPEIMARFGLGVAAARTLAAKVTDLMSFIHKRLDLLPFAEGLAATSVTYHAPCHLKNYFAPSDRLLSELPGTTYLPADNGHDCCGGGGTFFYEYPELSAKMSANKISGARRTGADLWLTECPVCRINLASRLTEAGSLKMRHPAQYLASLLQP